MSELILEAVSLSYDGKQVLESISLQVEDGKIACLLGPSGCGKTTLLRSIAGFEPLQQGMIKAGNRVLSTPEKSVATELREIGMVFQDFALFPHLSIARNICFGIRQLSEADQRSRLEALLELIGLQGFGERYPHQLSGGQQQRVALARAMAPRPRLLLLDEPFSSMDVELRGVLAKEIREILQHEGITTVMVTHDQHEAFSMADQIGVLSGGQLLQWGSAQTLYHHPKTAFVARFIGRSNFLVGTVNDGGVKTAIGMVSAASLSGHKSGDTVKVLVRPEYLQLDQENGVPATLISRDFRGGYYLYTLRLPSNEIVQMLLSSLADHELGESVAISLSTDQLSLFANQSPTP